MLLWSTDVSSAPHAGPGLEKFLRRCNGDPLTETQRSKSFRRLRSQDTYNFGSGHENIDQGLPKIESELAQCGEYAGLWQRIAFCHSMTTFGCVVAFRDFVK